MKIRKAGKKDIDQIVKLNSELADYHVKIDKYYKSGKETAPGFRKHLEEIITEKSFRIIVAEEKGKIVGFFIGNISPSFYAKPQKVGGLHSALVLKEFRRSGAGKLMFNDLIAWFKKNKVKNVELSVDVRNKIGGNVWKKFGFKDFMKRMKLDI